ncbi:hypothetical protein F5B22DRAFT_399085 [Xylaria bambusicola]|uniref:uncharacterized protein n=1 Tax=Xylaria bambusicola TaxID=326684 RepID=UPI0020073879|nr:uncharacterized protein F5B22DRAFT_399085 [Xylaria bambusicola]KAI0508489.1 hypothetical protein F5B22DRAFT_399085 [Xylaria bambusicola]
MPPNHPSSSSPSKPPSKPNSTPSPPSILSQPLPLKYWLLTLGTGPPPTYTGYLQMASERKAVYREQRSHSASQKAIRADLNAQLQALDNNSLRRKKPNRRDLMLLYGPNSKKVEGVVVEKSSTQSRSDDNVERKKGDGDEGERGGVGGEAVSSVHYEYRGSRDGNGGGGDDVNNDNNTDDDSTNGTNSNSSSDYNNYDILNSEEGSALLR